MAVQTTYFVGGGDALPSNRSGRTHVLKFQIDAATTNVASGDILKLMDIPANSFIHSAVANVTTAEGGTLTCDLGDYLSSNGNAVDADGFLDGFNGNSAAATSSTTETLTLSEGAPNTAAFSPAYARGKFYRDGTAYLGLLFNDAADAAIIDVLVVITNCNG